MKEAAAELGFKEQNSTGKEKGEMGVWTKVQRHRKCLGNRDSFALDVLCVHEGKEHEVLLEKIAPECNFTNQ